MPYVALWFRAFLFTVLMELLVLQRLFRCTRGSTVRRGVLVVYANLASHPCVWFVFPLLPVSYALQLVFAELWAFASEALFYAVAFEDLAPRRALWGSLLANVASLTGGLVLRHALDWV
ncbi:MAG: hypothetical protein WCI05_09500 [Myxococcales bacterium]